MKSYQIFCVAILLVASVQCLPILNIIQDKAGVLYSALVTYNLTSALNGTGPYTVFAPTNASLTAFINSLPANTPSSTVVSVLTYHVVFNKTILAADFVPDWTVVTLSGPTLRLNDYGAIKTVDGAQVIEANYQGDNGVVHIIDDTIVPPSTNIAGYVSNVNNSLNILKDYLVSTGLVSAFTGTTGNLTVFGPTDAAFTATLPQYLLVDRTASYNSNNAALKNLLLFHVLSNIQTVFSAGISNGTSANTLFGQTLGFTLNSAGVFVQGVNRVQVTEADLIQTNGVIHKINGVLIPSYTLYSANQLYNLTTLNSLLDKTGLNGTINDDRAPKRTLFGPNEYAFGLASSALTPILNNVTALTDVLLYHLISGEVKSTSLSNELLAPTLLSNKTVRINVYTGGWVTVNCAPIVAVDFPATNGILHVIENVLTGPPSQTIAQKAIATPTLSTLVQLLVLADLVSVVNGTGPFTVFAPTNAAFDLLGSSTLDYLKDAKNKATLTEILKYHVVSGTQCAYGLSTGAVGTLQGTSVYVTVTRNSLNRVTGVTVKNGINGSTNAVVGAADVLTTNGVVHIIDKVLVPSGVVIPSTTTTGTTTGDAASLTVSLLLVILAVVLSF